MFKKEITTQGSPETTGSVGAFDIIGQTSGEGPNGKQGPTKAW